jgi:nucleotide-binding universal stress UspA family protein
MYDTIVVPTDGSKHARRVAEHAAALAREFDATIHVVHAVDVQAEAGPFSAGGVDEEFVDRLESEGEKAVADVEAHVRASSVHTQILRGEPSEAILEYAADNDTDLVALGTHGRTGIRRYIAGSVTERVVRLSPTPVLTARATETEAVAGVYDDVLVPTDGSEYAAAATEHGLAIARRFDARVHAVNVVDVGAVTVGPDATPPTDLVDRLTARGNETVEQVAERARDGGLDATTAVREGIPATELLGYVDEADVDLVTMGTAGRTGLSQHLLGSTTERVLRRADVPVLTVTAKDQRGE